MASWKHRVMWTAVLVWSGLSAAPARATESDRVCSALMQDPVDIKTIRTATRAEPASARAICKVPRSALGQAGFMTLFAITGLAILPGVRDSARYARHPALQLALLRDSSGAARALAKAGADPTQSVDGASALTLAVMHDIEGGSTTWTDLVTLHWNEPLPHDALPPEALDRLYFAPALEEVLRSKGLRRHGLAADGTTWLHRALIQDWSLPDSDDAVIGAPIEGVEARGGELPRYEETLAPAANLYKEREPRLSFSDVMARGVPVNRRDVQGRSALYYAAYTGNWVAYDRLLGAGARPWKAGSTPASILFALAAGRSPERFAATLRQLIEQGHLVADDLHPLAGSLVQPEPVGWCQEPASMRPWFVECGQVPDQAVNRQLLASMGVGPSADWWTRHVKKQSRDVLQRAVDDGFVPPIPPVSTALRQKDWKVALLLLPAVQASPGALRRLDRLARRRGAPNRVRAAIRRAQGRAEAAR